MKLNHSLLDKIWITSDTHAFHKNITRGTTSWEQDGIFKFRDFDTPEEMTQRMADNFNSVIPEDGILFHLGDWSFAGKDNIEIFRKMLNVKDIFFIYGNHDQHIKKGDYDYLFTALYPYLELNIGNLNFCLFHFPIESWNNIRKGEFHLHGHQHLQGDLRFSNGKKMDVGVDGNDLYPYKLTDVVDLLKGREYQSDFDHHV